MQTLPVRVIMAARQIEVRHHRRSFPMPHLVATAMLLLLAGLAAAQDAAALKQVQLQDFGAALFFDVNLSRDRNQSCATCHDPARAFIDWRPFVASRGNAGDVSATAPVTGIPGPASVGTAPHLLGDRNAPTLSYAAHIPPFARGADGDYVGGLFWDGRANTLEDQAAGPPLNPIEMAMSDKAAVLDRLLENPNYVHVLRTHFGDSTLDDPDAAYAALTAGIAAFERTQFFSPFDSKYDRYLRGEYTPTQEEMLGMTLFFSNQFANCNKCHQLNTFPESEFETFSNYKYRNIGTPVNTLLRAANGLGPTYLDRALQDSPAFAALTGTDRMAPTKSDAANTDPADPSTSADASAAQAGRYRVPTLRNVALTAPYMHNGIFQDLRTVVLFYNKYLTRSSKAQINPESGEQWGPPEVEENLALEELESGRALDDRRIDALIAFMRMLTDKRYEPLLEFER
jgi:cytochrome c peroxidase